MKHIASTGTESESPDFDSEWALIRGIIAQISQAHYRLVWITGAPPGRRSDCIRSIAGRLGCPLLSVGQGLSSRVLDQPAPLRSAAAEDGFYEMLHQSKAEMICLDHLEILFDQSLMLKAADLVRNASRRFLLIAAWPGTADGTGLVFGPPDHPSYFRISYSQMECPVHHLSNS